MFHSTTGLVHTIFAIIAMVTGAVVLVSIKGTRFHVRVGYIYVISMLSMNISSFFLYHLFGTFGVFHWFAIFSLLTLLGGMYPVLFRKHVRLWYYVHLKVMSWSVVGLYAAFVAEVGTRSLPLSYFWLTVGLGTFAVCGIGRWLIERKLKEERLKAQY
ncbi:DUF2306 domain-containing protein [Sungkyunkwania multivorans]|uniref:DUF2306 domain-containing protein n=1 Tax=Sungkyunkwania multivorans TaxID=1173618 RepID=A0ABW3CU79_9FLAO